MSDRFKELVDDIKGALLHPEALDELLRIHAHGLAEQQREAIPDDAPAWVKVIPDLIDDLIGPERLEDHIVTADRIPLSPAQLAALQDATRARADTIVRNVLQQPDYPPLPACPECGAGAERIRSMVEPSALFEHPDPAVLINFAPCGHRFRTVVPVDGLPAEADR